MVLCSAGPSAPVFAAVASSVVADTAAAAVTAVGSGCGRRAGVQSASYQASLTPPLGSCQDDVSGRRRHRC